MEGVTVLFIQCSDLSVNHIQKHPHRNVQHNVLPNIWAPHGPVKLTQICHKCDVSNIFLRHEPKALTTKETKL